MLPEVEGKKVFVDDFLIGTIKQLTYDEIGNQVVLIETVFSEMPTFQVEAIALRKITKDGEEAFQLKSVPVKLKELIEQKKLEEEMKRAEMEVAEEEIPIIEEKPAPPPAKPAVVEKPPAKKKSIWQRILDFFRRLFKRGKKEKKPTEAEKKVEKEAPEAPQKKEEQKKEEKPVAGEEQKEIVEQLKARMGGKGEGT